MHEPTYKSTRIILGFRTCSFGLPSFVTCLPPPCFISKPFKMELFLKCLHTHPHSLNCTPCLGAVCVRSGRPIAPCSERLGVGQQDGAGLEGTLEAAHSSPIELRQSQKSRTAWLRAWFPQMRCFYPTCSAFYPSNTRDC